MSIELAAYLGLRYISSIELFDPSWAVFGLLLSSLVAYFTLLNNLSSTLDSVGTKSKGQLAQNRLTAISQMASILRTLTLVSLVLLGAHILRLFSTSGPSSFVPSYTMLILILIAVWTPINLLILAVAGYMCATMIYKFRRDDAENACRRMDAAIHLKCGRILKGSIYDLSFLSESARYLALCRKDFSYDVVSLSEVAAIFLQQEYAEKDELKKAEYIEGRRALTLMRPHEEKLPTVRHFRSNGFAILELDKPTTTARFAIVDDLVLRGL